jgi:RHS repeat-associated protein
MRAIDKELRKDAAIRRTGSLVGLIAGVALGAFGCGGAKEDPAGAASSDVEAKSAPLTHAQVGTAKAAGLLPGSAQFEWMYPVVAPGVSPLDSYALDINSAGVVVGDSDDSTASISYPYVKDAAGQRYTPGPWPDGSNSFMAIADDGRIVGDGGPASSFGNSRQMQRPFLRSPDGTVDHLPGVPIGTVFRHMVLADSTPPSPLIVGATQIPGGPENFPGTMAYWPFTADGTDKAWSLSNMPTVASDIKRVDGDHLPYENETTPFLRMDGTRCLSIPQTNGQHYAENWDAPGAELGITMMGWVRIQPGTCTTSSFMAMFMASWEAFAGVQCSVDAAGNESAKVTGGFFQPGAWAGLTPMGDIPIGEWAHIALTWDHHTVRTYVNGNHVGSQPYDGTFNPYGNWFSVGCWPQSPVANFKGDLREVQVLRNPLPPELIVPYKDGQGFHTSGYGNGMGFLRMDDLDGQPEYSYIPMPSVGNGKSFWWNSEPHGISKDGTVVGFANYVDQTQGAVVYRPGSPGMADLTELLGDDTWQLQSADAINASRVAVGYGVHNGVDAAYSLDLDSMTITDLGQLETTTPFADHYVTPTSINSAGHIVGTQFSYLNWVPESAFIYTPESLMTNLNDLVPPSQRQDPNGDVWVLRTAVKINDNDEIIGEAQDSAGRSRAYKIKLQGLPALAQLECYGQPDGTLCAHGNWCKDNNVCYLGTCGGPDPADAVCLRVDGVVADSKNRSVVLFGFHNNTGSTVMPALNQELIDGTVVPSPDPAPPPWLPNDDHPAAYRPTFLPGQAKLSWRVNGQLVTANPTPTLQAEAPGVVQLPGQPPGQPPIVFEAQTSQYKKPPGDPTSGGEPPIGPIDKGTLTGSLGVSPMGASVYTVPITMPPGIAGMAPNLALVYNSQGGDGIAGQGWDLSGLSTVHLCPKTYAQDGVTEAIDLNRAPARGGICLDGQRLFEQPDGTYKLEIDDNSTEIRMGEHGYSFTVKTKSGETRYYGSKADSRIFVKPETTTGPSQVGIWALDKVVDEWGNYYTLTYNGGQGDFAARGLIVTSIDYTGHLENGSDANSGASPFSTITFTYDDHPRKDVRRLRLGQWSMPRNQLLKKITTPLGFYTLDYKRGQDAIDDTMLPSQLETITYCPDRSQTGDLSNCETPLTFDWQGGGFSMAQNDRFAPPRDIDLRYWADQGRVVSRGTAFVDINGDGNVDFLKASPNDLHAWLNDGKTFVPYDAWKLPNVLVDQDGDPGGTTLADMDGDGLLDYVENPRPGAFCDPAITTNGCASQVNIRIYINHTKNGCVGEADCWEPAIKFAPLPAGWGNVNICPVDPDSHDRLADMNGDGRADLVRVVPATYDPSTHAFNKGELKVLLNLATGWVDGNQFKFSDSVLRGKVDDYQLVDVNRDGLTDLVSTRPDSDGTYYVGLNAGGGENVWTIGSTDADPNKQTDTVVKRAGDINGDGLYDSIQFSTQDQQAEDYSWITVTAPNVAIGTGVGYSQNIDASAGFLSVLQSFLPPLNYANQYLIKDTEWWSYFGMDDLNGDGLADLIRVIPGQVGRVYANNGDTWKDITGATTPSLTPDSHDLPFVPATGTFGDVQPGIQFVDLDGDGIRDLVQAAGGVHHAWINTFKPPMITGFPNGLARKTTVNYYTISSGTPTDAVIYSDLEPVAAGTTAMTPPIRVVSSVSVEDGRAIGELATTTYRYKAFRGSAYGRGAQGFHSITVREPDDVPDPADPEGTPVTVGTETTTTYSQFYPYTGMPTSVVKKKGNTTLSETSTYYCDAVLQRGQTPSCSAQDYDGGAVLGGVKGSRPVYVKKIVDKTSLIGGNNETITTTTDIQKDSYGNQIEIDVDTLHSSGEEYKNVTSTYYDVEGSDEQKQGKPTKSTTQTQRIDVPPPPYVPSPVREHSSYMSYTPFGSFMQDGTSQQTLALKFKLQEPDSAESEHAKVMTVYDYDKFGHTITTRQCESDFGTCFQGGPNPAGTSGDADHRPFRETTTSYSISDLRYVTAPGVAPLIQYGDGRFPVKTTNAQGESEYHVYDPLLGVVMQTQKADGLHTCFDYDVLGRQTRIIERCGSRQPLAATTDYRQTPALFMNSQVMTVTRAPGGSVAWTWVDILGRKAATIHRGFDGSWIEEFRTFDALGRPSSEMEPAAVSSWGVSGYFTKHKYDVLGPEKITTRQLGDVGLKNKNPIHQVTRTFLGSTVKTEETVTVDESGDTPVTLKKIRTERKNALGKTVEVANRSSRDGQPEVVDNSLTYIYDDDGNQTHAVDGLGHDVSADFDLLHRRITGVDPDMGTWHYVYNAYGDLVSQTDAKQVETTMSYDNLGRMRTKTGPLGTAYWVYDTEGISAGKLVAKVGAPEPSLGGHCDVPFIEPFDGNRAVSWSTFDDLGQQSETFDCVDGTTSSTRYEYDAAGRQGVVRYPEVAGSRFSVRYNYTSLGYLQYLSDDATQEVVWKAEAMNPRGQVTLEQLANGVETTRDYNPAVGWLMSSKSVSHAEADAVLQDWRYNYDELGNVKERDRLGTILPDPSFETFTYDSRNRLMSSRVQIASVGPNAYDSTESFVYDDAGNLTRKNGQEITYGSTCSAHTRLAGPHAPCAFNGSEPFEYDDNGNLVRGNGRTASYDSRNKPVEIVDSQRATRIEFSYSADGDRVLQFASTLSGDDEIDARTLYFGMGGTGKGIYERTIQGDDVTHTQFIYAMGNTIAVRTVKTSASSGDVSRNAVMGFYHVDGIGSVTAISDEQGNVVDSTWGNVADATIMGYEPWGTRRGPDGRGAAADTRFNLQAGHREFTGHETVPGVGLVNMNGRIYDPGLGRFLSPDPTIQFPDNPESYNRYAYVLNNPIGNNDPTGYRSAGHVFGGDADIVVGMLMPMITAIACVNPFVCVGAIALNAAWSAATMHAEGVGWEQIVGVTMVNVGVGALMQAAAPGAQDASNHVIRSAVMGATSHAISSVMTTAILGGHFDQVATFNIISGAVMAAASAARAEQDRFQRVSIGSRRLSEDARFSQELQRNGDGKGRYGLRWTSDGTMRLDDQTIAQLSEPFHELAPRVDLRNVVFVLDSDIDAAYTDEYTSTVHLPAEYFERNQVTKDFTLVHELAHIAQISHIGPFNASVRRDTEVLKDGPFAVYRRSSDLVRAPFQNFNVVDQRWDLEAIAQNVAYKLTNFSGRWYMDFNYE